MHLNFLISISSESENLYGVRFLCSFMQPFRDCRVTLFHIKSDTGSPSAKTLLSMWQEPAGGEKKVVPGVAAGRAMARAEQLLQGARFYEDAMAVKTIREKYGKIKDILGEAADGLYDALILGRRASYALQWMFERPADEIHQAMICDAALSSPLWFCPEPEEGRENVLLCLDGSTSALRTADHVGYILSFLPRHTITLFHVTGPMQRMDDTLFNKAVDILLHHDLASERIQVKKATGISVAGTILAEAERGKYAAVAVGLNGQSSRGATEAARGAGKITTALIADIGKAALWCCP